MAVPLLRSVLDGGNAFEVEIETLAPRSIQSSVLASGRLVHEEEVQLTTEEIGKVTGIFVEEGDRVKEGQLLLQIDDEIFQSTKEAVNPGMHLIHFKVSCERVYSVLKDIFEQNYSSRLVARKICSSFEKIIDVKRLTTAMPDKLIETDNS